MRDFFGTFAGTIIGAITDLFRANGNDNIERKVDRIMIDLSGLQASVTAMTSVEAGTLELIKGMAAQIAAIPPSTDPATQATLDSLVSQLNAHASLLASAVTANTPVAPAPVAPPAPPVAPVDPPAAPAAPTTP